MSAYCYASHSALTGAPYSVPVEGGSDRRPPAYAEGLYHKGDDALYAPVRLGMGRVRSAPYARALGARPQQLDPSRTVVTYTRHPPFAAGAPTVAAPSFGGRLVTRGEWYDDADSTFSYRFVWEGEDSARVVPHWDCRTNIFYERFTV
jgi:hypothetical protein